MKKYSEDNYLQLSGIQHFVFCRRQWALIVIEQTWVESYLTLDGRIMHDNAHDGLKLERRGDLLISRGLPVSSHQLGLSGICDVVEFKKTTDPQGVFLYGLDGKYLATPIEYKRGKVKIGREDEVQVAAQAMALEEMLLASIKEAFIFYGQHQRRHKVNIDEELRQEVKSIAEEMHGYAERAYVPRAKLQAKCEACSLYGICLPQLYTSMKVDSYIEEYANEKTT
ncbi:MAG: CRISPR-associated protein Cas4 [Clostridiaceae bacterium]|nr:CRISPR-associated protein Cas4 [Clostridiaceae bacterium]